MNDTVTYFLIGIPAWIVGITLIVFVHELGHFLLGRLFGVTIETFSIGFGPEIVGWNDRKNTRWKVSWIPFGGYVKFLGDADASSRTDVDAVTALSPEQRAHTLQAKPLWQRALVVAAGPIANFILAILIFAAIDMVQETPVYPPTVAAVQKNSPAEEAGFRAGDVVHTVNGRPAGEFLSFAQTVMLSPGQMFHVGILRGAQRLTIDVKARRREVALIDGSKQTIGQLGLMAKVGPTSPGRAFVLAFDQTWDVVSGTFNYIGKMITGAQGTGDLGGH